MDAAIPQFFKVTVRDLKQFTFWVQAFSPAQTKEVSSVSQERIKSRESLLCPFPIYLHPACLISLSHVVSLQRLPAAHQHGGEGALIPTLI
jgi:hypothetical protein